MFGYLIICRCSSDIHIDEQPACRLDNISDPSSFPDLDESDPKSLGRWMRKMSAETGEDLGPEFDEVVGRLEAGEDPEAIEKSMPELAGEGGGMPYGAGDGLDDL